jgi:hypothetical protein
MDLALILAFQMGLVWFLDCLLPGAKSTVRDLHTSRHATVRLSEQTARRMVERAYASTACWEDRGPERR